MSSGYEEESVIVQLIDICHSSGGIWEALIFSLFYLLCWIFCLRHSKIYINFQIAVRSHIKTRNLNADDTLILVKPRDGEYLIREEDVLSLIEENGNEIALVFLGGINYFTGQVFDMEKITKLAHSYGCIVAFDLAHAVGNIKLDLHQWGPDFAVWCTYKYLNSGNTEEEEVIKL